MQIDSLNDQFIAASFQDHIVAGSVFSFEYNNQNTKIRKNDFYAKATVESAGGLLHQIHELIGKDKNQYNENNTPITLLENTLFSNEIDFPTNLHEGNYKVKIHLIRFQKVLATKQDIIYVKKIGLQNWINYLAFEKPQLYGIMSILIAITFGFVASLVFRKKI